MRKGYYHLSGFTRIKYFYVDITSVNKQEVIRTACNAFQSK